LAESRVIDYYQVLNLPVTADLMGIENAYARLSSELVKLGEIDPGTARELDQVNEAYGVLSRPELRRQYDAVFLARQREEEAKQLSAFIRRQSVMQWSIIGVLVALVVFQLGFLAYIGRDQLGGLTSLFPGG
jgi:curved DNA-binding protein CbpA